MEYYGIREMSDWILFFDNDVCLNLKHCSTAKCKLGLHSAHICLDSNIVPHELMYYILHHRLTKVQWTDIVRYVSNGKDGEQTTTLDGNWQVHLKYKTNSLGKPVKFQLQLFLEADNESKL